MAQHGWAIMMEKIGPYRVVEQIGVGGMGEVYKAYDDRLDRWVAIKRIRDDKDQGEENRERFRREARATARLNHSSIVHLYDIFSEGNSDCIVMEFVEGLTLDKLIRNGPLEAVQAATLGHEIASGLVEAHAKGIIHRDLKVENVIVTPDGHAKILDFGLARPFLAGDLDASLTGKGQLVGTSRTMSPEYVGGEDIDHRSDLFSLGVLLYEAVTSHSPFKAHNTLATLKQVMLHRQTPAHLVNTNVPEDFSSVIENLLEKDPEDRPQDAKEVARELGHISGKLSSGDVDRPSLSGMFTATPTEVISPSATSVDIWSLRRLLAITAVLLAAIAAGTYLFTKWWLAGPEIIPIQGMPDDPVIRQKDRIVLADFQNLTGEPLLDDSIALVFRLGLEQSRHAYVLPSSHVQSALLRMERDANTPVDRVVGMEIGQREGARALVVGAIGKVGETYTVTAEVVDPQTGVTSFSAQENAGSQDEIFQILGAITASIRVDLGESVAEVEEARRPLEKVTTRNLEALKAYSLGQARIGEGKHEDAIQLLERSLELDPDFAMAHARLATVYLHLDHNPGKALMHLDQALRRSDRLPEVEKLYVDGWAARLRGDPKAVVRAWSLMSSLHRNEFTGHHNLGMAHWTYFQRFEEAAKAFEAAIRVAAPEELSQALSLLAYCQIALGHNADALETLGKTSGPYKDLVLVDLYLASGNYSKARSQIETVAVSSRIQQLGSSFRLAELHASQGNLREARKEAHEAVRLSAIEGVEQYGLAARLALIAAQEHVGPREDLVGSLELATRAALDLLERYRDMGDPSPVPLLALVGKMNARNKQTDNAELIYSAVATSADDASLTLWRSHAILLEGELLAARQEHRQALTRFKAAVDIADSFQIHDSLAQTYEASGLVDEAIAEYEWIVGHRGQGLVECINECPAFSSIHWTLAFNNLGRLYEQRGDRDRAIEHYATFLEHWSEGKELDVWQVAKRRLEALKGH